MLSTADGSDLLWQRLCWRSAVRSAATTTFSLSSIPARLCRFGIRDHWNDWQLVAELDELQFHHHLSIASQPAKAFFLVFIVFIHIWFPTAFISLIYLYKPHWLESAHSADLQSINFQAKIHFKYNAFSTFWSFFMNEIEAHVYIIHGAFGQLPFVSMEMVVSQGPLRRIAR